MSDDEMGSVAGFLNRACDIHGTVRRQRDDARKELARCMRDIGDIADELRGVETERSSPPIDVVLDARKLWNEHAAATTDRDQLKSDLEAALCELRQLLAEREPRDNGDGTCTQLLPVTFEAKLSGRVVAVRKPTEGENYLDMFGNEGPANGREHGVRLILSPPEPAKPEPVTWRCALADGEWVASEGRVCQPGGPGVMFSWGERAIHGFATPPQLGLYLFKDGVGTLIEASK